MVRQLKLCTAKKKKSEDDLMEIRHLEFLAGLYVNEKQEIIIPGVNLEACFVSGAKKEKRGQDAKVSILVPEDPLLIYSGPKKPEDLWQSGKFHDVRSVVVQKNRVFRCRPYFKVWALEFVAQFSPGGVDADVADNWLKTCGEQVGLGDYRPRFGRFEVISAKDVKNVA